MTFSVGYERGLHVRGSPLWFDSERRRELCVLTSVEQRLPPVHRRIVASAPLAAALSRAGYAGPILPASWDRWMGLGGCRLQLIEGGAPPGAAAALIEGDDERMVIAGLLRSRALQWPRAHHLVARVPALFHRGEALRDVALLVAARVEKSLLAGHRPAVWVDSLEIGLALQTELALLGRPVQPRGLLSKLTAQTAPSTRRATLSVGLGRDGIGPHAIRIDSGLGRWAMGGDCPAPIGLRWFADMAALRAAVLCCRATSVSLVGVLGDLEKVVRAALGKTAAVRFLGTAAHQLTFGSQPPI